MKAKLITSKDSQEFEKKMNNLLSLIDGDLVDIEFSTPNEHWYSALVTYKE